ncbi:hypothetical protein BO70DRAFT_98568 [Aspergillus heteromorphus CBS 117.55]|uniref:Uncharacterized protein n=1 Tax=Aspergillus heteromorphus CBS 117.55 TaxID=1448321 RepID=A0A317VR86_9EURO|nr:uncharacterized protein BO70DRAFT_98568 [Aspergillus heteromorphus CBS 117.55]PWY75527.1 hypothetical protein BO70DRAFT_98568 [Aspergillus heteromorphus CBS 117.55]
MKGIQIHHRDITPSVCPSIIKNTTVFHLPEIRSFLARHIDFSPYINVSQSMDAPSGGTVKQDAPIWEARYYFLTVLAVRLSQVTMEWTELVHAVEKSLAPYSEIDEIALLSFVEKGLGLERTKQRTWTLGILRRLRNSLAKLITAWHAFDSEQSSCLDLDAAGALPDRFREKFSQMRGKVSDVLVHASALLESITATRQGNNIEILIYITITYLPVSRITVRPSITQPGRSADSKQSCFGMNQVPSDVARWSYWVSIIGLTVLTALVALTLPFGLAWWKAGGLCNVWRGRGRGRKGG